MARAGTSKSATTSTSKLSTSEDTLLTQENFEKELKALASKAQEETWSKRALEQAWILTQSAIVLSLAAAYSIVAELSLSPVYGRIPSSIYHGRVVMTACFLGWSSNLYLKRHLPVKLNQLLPLIAVLIPTAQFLLFKFSGTLGARYGPVITESLTFFPLLVLSISCTATLLDDLEMSIGRWTWMTDALPGILSFSFFKTVEYFSGSFVQRTIGESILQTRLGLQIGLAGLYSLYSPSKLLLFALPAVLHTALFNPHVPTSYATAALNTTMQQDGWSLLERKESLTGYISILETPKMGFRIMRCDHSLLGGEWLTSMSMSSVAEPIYGVFVMLEAVRLVKTKEPVKDEEASAFVVGLGIGTTPTAFMQHGISTTIVEIDPVVHEFATKYFALPPNHISVIQDAVSYASEMAQSGKKYDYVIHDVFTGGAEPVDLFTYEFLSDLNTILSPGGVIAINYAGDLLLPSARITISTILTIFPLCRIFRESAPPSPETVAHDGRDFTNMVIFCTNAPLHEGKLEFRSPVANDYLMSGARKAYLMPKFEVDRSVFGWSESERSEDGIVKDLLYKNSTEKFGSWQQESALGHWAVMRTVLPKEIWEDW